MKTRNLLLVAAVVLAVAGCATGEAGRATTPQDFRSTLRIESFTATAGDSGSVVVTFTVPGSLSTVPTSTATQTPTNTTSTEATVPASVIGQ